MERCETCKHWRDDQEWEAETVGFRRCFAVRARWKIEDDATAGLQKYPDAGPTVARGEYEDGVGAAWVEAHQKAFTAAKAYTQDGSSYRAELYTAPDFGCVLHEPVTG